MLKFLILLIIPLFSYANCPMTLQGILDNSTSSLLDQLKMPNCTDEVHETSTMCNCAKDYSKFKDEKSIKVVANFKNEVNKQREEELLNGARAKIVSMIYDLNYADNILEINDEEKQKLTQENNCNLNTFKEAVKKTCGNNPLIGNKKLEILIDEFQIEGLHIASSRDIKEKGFFDREKKSCDIDDNYLLKIQHHQELYALIHNEKEARQRTFATNPIGHYLINLDIKTKLPTFKNINDVKKYLADKKQDFLKSFGTKCQQNFKDAAIVLCSNLSESKISDDDFLNAAEISPYMYYEDKGFLEAQEKISSFCSLRENGTDKYTPLKNLLQHGSNKIDNLSKKEERELLKKERQDLFKMSEAIKEDFPKNGHEKMFNDSCQIISSNRPITPEKLKQLNCSIENFEKNFKNSSRENDEKANCPLLVLDYILNTSEEELTKQKVDKELIAFKKESNEKSTSESKGSGLLTSFLSISKPETVAKFKAAGIDAKPADNGSKTVSNNSNSNTKTASSSNSAPQRNVMNVPQQSSQKVVQNSQASSQGQAQSYAPQYNQLFPNLAPSEREQIQDIEKEIMRRLGTSNEKSQVERQRAEMYKSYSKELEDLAKERKRLESSNNKNPKDVANYDKKMQDLIDQMKAENKKLAQGQNDQNEVMQTGTFNNEQAQSFGTTRTASNANSFGTPSSPVQSSIMNDATNKALNETVNRERFNELTGKKDASQTNRSPAALETVNQKFALIENGRVIEISSMDELINQKRSMNEPFIIAFKDSPTMRVEIVPTKQGYTFKPLGNLQNKEYRSFFMEVKMTLENEKQSFHREELQEKLGKIKN